MTPQPSPQLRPGTQQPLSVHSTVGDLPLYTFTVTADYAICDLIEHFSQRPDLPGVVICEVDQVSVLSRQQFLEFRLHFGQSLRLDQESLRRILPQANRYSLTLVGDVSILNGAQQALRRSPNTQGDPLIVVQDNRYHLLEAHTLNVAHWQIRGIETQIRYERMQMQLLQSEKMAALGRLVDGVAHEILDPVSFIWGNLSYIDTYTQQQADLITAYSRALPTPPTYITQLKDDIEFDYLRSDLPAAIKSARGGAHRLRQLAASLQNFCHIDEVQPRPTDLNTLIDNTLRLLKSRLITPLSVHCAYGKLPPIPCFPGQISQVLITLFTHAINDLLAQAKLADDLAENTSNSSSRNTGACQVASQIAPQITVTTCVRSPQDTFQISSNEARWVSVIISDNGPGLPPHTKAQIIESFSIKSRSRKETGLALSYQIITARHGGKFWMRSFHASEKTLPTASSPPTGTEFEILLPLTSSESDCARGQSPRTEPA
ncbi:MAG: ATP-binding protein [Phormidesmis sp.]